ncbi:MAG: SRPBCC domain-containing protein [Euryarchaeota archaeon]|nr:SRPBCC domain-containing protein [Euryarchaeota archaeon]MDE1835871.1 SRPBCC domain-containing protein [Euryarchaeota archaeon]MDE1882117.1 SRPBCC domain-containing protein [Euryarchaeota archaeon]MDE2044451.1 SRPBCC domain-containing protein [Thermoplasmata archaeon]
MSAATLLDPDGRVQLEHDLPAPPEVVWKHLVDPDLRAKWLGTGTLDPVVGGHVDLRVADANGTLQRVRGTVTLVERPRVLEWVWRTAKGSSERVRIDLDATTAGTRFRLVHDQSSDRISAPGVLFGGAALTALTASILHSSSPPAERIRTEPAATTIRIPRRSPSPSFWRKGPVLWVALMLIAGGAGAAVYFEYRTAHLSGPSSTACKASPSSSPLGEPGPPGDSGWERITSASCVPWTTSGVPVVMFLSSIACPYCDASSWAMEASVQNFTFPSPVVNIFSGFTTSSPTDIYPNTPGLNLAGDNSTSAFISFNAEIGTNPTQITIPSLPPPGSSYVSSFDAGGGIPFLVIGGIFVHRGSLVSPAVLESNSTPLSPATVASGINNCEGSISAGPLCSGVVLPQLFVEAYLYKADLLAGVQPPTQYIGGNPQDLAMVENIASTIQ